MSDYQGQHEGLPAEEEPVIGDAPPKDKVLLSNGAYDKLLAASLYILPALAAAYFGVAQIWGLPKAAEVVGTVVVLETLIGALIRISRQQYENSDAKYDGAIVIEPGENEHSTNLNVSLDPEAVASKKEIVVKVDRV